MVTWQLTIDCNDPSLMVRFWGPALGYEVTPPPDGFDTWNDWYRSVGVPEDELDDDVDAADRLFDPKGEGPKIWFQIVPEGKSIKNRLHLDLYPSGGRSVPLERRKALVDAFVAELIEAGATVRNRYPEEFGSQADPNGYYVGMYDPEGNEFCVS